MSNLVLSKYHRHIRPLMDEEAVNTLLTMLVAIPHERQDSLWIRNNDVGSICLYEHETAPGKILEYVQGSQEDSVTTLYGFDVILSNRQALIDARRALIQEIGIVLMALPSTITVYDAGRGRQAVLKELGTAQLIDVLAHFSHTDLETA